jgi:hypothetical protein
VVVVDWWLLFSRGTIADSGRINAYYLCPIAIHSSAHMIRVVWPQLRLEAGDLVSLFGSYGTCSTRRTALLHLHILKGGLGSWDGASSDIMGSKAGGFLSSQA